MQRMAQAFEIECSHCGDRHQFPATCTFGLDSKGTAHLLERPERDATRLFKLSWTQLKAAGRVRAGLPTTCLECGHLGAHRADQRHAWKCENCGGGAIYQLGADLRSMMFIGASLLSLLLVVVPATSSALLALPGVVGVALYLSGCLWLVHHGNSRLSRAPCSRCAQPGLREHRVAPRPISSLPRLAPALSRVRRPHRH